jgi:hypothetical protein
MGTADVGDGPHLVKSIDLFIEESLQRGAMQAHLYS